MELTADLKLVDNPDPVNVPWSMPSGYDKCTRCNGSGLVQNWYVEDCPECYGGGLTRKRDARGRFAK